MYGFTRASNRKMDSETDYVAAWIALEEKYDAVSNAARQELYEELAKTKMEGQDPDDFLYTMETALLVDYLHGMGGVRFLQKVRDPWAVREDPRRLKSRSEGEKAV